jgi:hypothetical protein
MTMTISSYAIESRYAGSSRPVSLFRARLTREMFLICHLGISLLLEWRLPVDPIGTLELMIDIGGPALSRHERLLMAEELNALIDCDDADADGPLPNATLLLVATGWFCRRDLRGDRDGPPEDRPTGHRHGLPIGVLS